MNNRIQQVEFTKSDLAKYAFFKGTAEYIRPLDLQIGELTSAEMEQVLRRAEERVTEAILYVRITRNQKATKIGTEISTYSVALMLVTSTGNSFIKKRYALAEAKQASADLASDKKDVVSSIAQNLGWKLSSARFSIKTL